MKNIVFILTDQQHFRTIRANGCAEADTPHLDRLAAEGINFQNHFVANPVCSPSRGAIWTGRFPSENGLYANGCKLPEESPTLPQVFSANGFATAHFGKLHLEPTMNHGLSHCSYGFETCELGEGDQFLTHDDYNLWLREKNPRAFFEYYHQMGEKGHIRAYTSNLPEELTLSHWVTERGTNWLADRKSDARPFFLSLGFFDPHHAWNPCEPYASQWAGRAIEMPGVDPADLACKPAHWAGGHGLDPFDLSSIIRSYHAMVSHLDACVGRLMETLEATGLAKDTIVVFSSDHGEFLGNHGKLFKGPFLCDDLLRVPLIVWDGARRVGGKSTDSLTSSLDFWSTLPALAGIENNPTAHSRRMLDNNLALLPDGPRSEVVSEWRSHPFEQGSGGNITSIRTPEARYVRYANTGDEELYDLTTDPAETRNLASDPKWVDTKVSLAERLNNAAPPVPNAPPPSAPW